MVYYCVWVGGLKSVVQEKDLNSTFSKYGTVLHVKVLRDPETQKSKHCGFVVFRDESTAEQAARSAKGTVIHGGLIIVRGPAEQKTRGHSGKYDGKIGYVPSIENDRRPCTDCIHYVNGACTNGFNCPYRHSSVARSPSIPECLLWSNGGCSDVSCPRRHPGPKQKQLSAVSNDPVVPIFSLSISDQDDSTIKLATQTDFLRISAKFCRDWADGKGSPGEVKAIYMIENPALKRSWTRYRQSLPSYYQQTEEHYHGTKLMCNMTSNDDLCCALECSVCRIVESGFDEQKIRTNIPNFQRFGRGFYLAPKSSKCHDYTQGNSSYNYRALLLCDVSPGNKYPLKRDDRSLDGPPASYHSIHGQAGGSLNYDEVVLPRADAILPKFIIIYRKDGVYKIAK